MSTSASPPSRDMTIDVSGTPGVPLIRLVKVELRKSFDTRSGRWYSIAVIGLCVIVMLAQSLLFNDGFQDYSDFLLFQGATLGFFLPVIPILLVTSEWSQRTGLVTFGLEPRRARIVVAKFGAGAILAVGALVLAALIAAVGVVLTRLRGLDASWSLEYSQIQNFVLANLIAVFLGFAFAMLLMNTPAAIVAYFFYAFPLPIVITVVSSLVSWFGDLAPWIEFNTAQMPLFSGDFAPTGQEWAQIAVSGTIWLLIPLALGVLRLLRSEVK